MGINVKKIINTDFISTVKNRFYYYTTIPNENGCMEWTGARDRKGYGMLMVNHKHVLSHRLSYQLFKGEIPKGMCICHTCDNTKCVAPDHLWCGTQKENILDRLNKGRSARQSGEKNAASTLTDSQAIEIKKLLNTTNMTQVDIAKKFNVEKKVVWRIKNNISWKHLEG